MSTPFYDLASLVLVPSGYKSQKVYAQKPLTTDGQLTFSRASDATRVNSAGLIEKVRTNIFPYGNALTSAGWNTTGATLTAGQTDPNGGTNAMRVQLAGGATNGIYYSAVTSAGLSLTRSVYIKAASAQTIVFEDPSGTGGITINLTTSYQRFSLSLLATGGGNYGVWFNNSNDNAAKDFTIAFVQIETGDIATDYIATTSAAVSVGPVANVPRLDYLNSSCPRLLLEPQRTNLATSSENLSGAGWSSQGSTITSNATTSPDGYSNADAIVETATTDEHNRIAVTSLTAASYTASVFLKKFNQTWCAVYLFNGTVGIRHWINLDTLTAGTSANIGAGITAPLTLTNYGNGWVRASMTWTADATSWSFYIACARSNGGATTYAGDGTSGLYAWGAQVEAGAYATSYIPTLGAAVTRGADACSKTGISSLLNSSQGTIFLQVERIGPSGDSAENLIFISDTSTSNFVNIVFDISTSRYRAQVRESGVTTGLVSATSAYTGSIKIAMAYAANDLVLYINGVQQGIDTSVTIPSATFNSLGLGGVFDGTYFDTFRGNYSQTLLFKTRLTNAQLAELTTL